MVRKSFEAGLGIVQIEALNELRTNVCLVLNFVKSRPGADPAKTSSYIDIIALMTPLAGLSQPANSSFTVLKGTRWVI